MAAATAFSAFAARRSAQADAAPISPLRTIDDRARRFNLQQVATPWTAGCYDGPFHLAPLPDAVPALSLVFVQSSDGNTGADDPGELGGGDTDKHLIYEGLTRVAADGVMAGATTANGPDVFFSIWRRELVELRRSLGFPRHPAQIVVTGRGRIDFAASLIFNVPDVPVFVLGSAIACAALAAAARERPWVQLLPTEPGGLRGALATLRRNHGITRISAIGGRTTATALADEHLVQDLYLTTSDRPGGQPGTPWYAGARPPSLARVVAKRSTDPRAPFLFEHLTASSPSA